MFSGKGTILLVEDDPSLRDLLVRILRKTDLGILHTDTGYEALKIGEEREWKIDLLITDVLMPGMNGMELAREVRVKAPEVCVLFLSGCLEGVSPSGVSLEDVGDFLEKPVTAMQLLDKVKEILTRSHGECP